jgi:hypothetical protein
VFLRQAEIFQALEDPTTVRRGGKWGMMVDKRKGVGEKA